ncbi:MAG: hypothetical protein ACTSSM_15830 [Promethearchaeota archaeon]
MLVGTPIVTLIIINTRFIQYIDDETVKDVKSYSMYFLISHQNEDGLFIEPDIDSNYRAVDKSIKSKPYEQYIPAKFHEILYN